LIKGLERIHKIINLDNLIDDQRQKCSPAHWYQEASFTDFFDSACRHSKSYSNLLLWAHLWRFKEHSLSYKHPEISEMQETKGFCGVFKQSFFWAHLATSIAAWLPFVGRHKLQHEDEVPHFFWQASRAGMHFESFWQAAHSLGHFFSTHCWGSAIATAVSTSTLFKQSLSIIHFQRLLAAGLPFLARQVDQQVWLSVHSLSQSWRAAKHF